MNSNYEKILKSAQDLRWDIGVDFHEKTMEALYTDATRIADRAVTYPDEKPRFDLDRNIDRLVTSRVWGFPLMILMLTLVFWLTISGANAPSGLLYSLLIGTIHPLLKPAPQALGCPGGWLEF